MWFVLAVVALHVLATGAQQENCPTGWYYYKRHCYQAFSYPSRGWTWYTARARCLSLGSHLASIRSAEEAQSILSYLSTHSNFGTSTLNVYIGLRINNGIQSWDDGRVVTRYENFAPGQPNLGHSGGDCVYMRYSNGLDRDKWYTQDCGTRSYHWNLCKRPSVCGSQTSRFYYQNKCYTYNSKSLTHNEASTTCRLVHGYDVLSLHSDTETARVSTWLAHALSGTWGWIGLNSSASGNAFEWLDRTDVDYTNWLVGEPAKLSVPRCVVVFRGSEGNPSQGKWRVADCNLDYQSFCVLHLSDNSLVPFEDSKEAPVLITQPRVPSDIFSVSCTSSGMKFALPFDIVPVSSFSTPCLSGQVDDAFFRYYWGNMAGVPGTSTGPLQGWCKCTGRKDNTNSNWLFDFRYDECLTQVAGLEADKISYVNKLFSGELTSTEKQMRLGGDTESNHTGYELQKFVSIGLRCDFKNVITASGYGFLVDIFAATIFNLTDVGTFTMASTFVQGDQPVSSDIHRPVTFDVATPITFEIALTTSTELGMRPLQCWVSTGDLNQFPKEPLIQESCPTPSHVDDVIIGNPLWQGGNSSTNTRVMRLSYAAFAFEGQEDSTYYLHCTFRVCSPQNQARCTNTCQSAARRKRQVVDDDEGLITVSSQAYNYDHSQSPFPSRRSSGSTSSPTSVYALLPVAVALCLSSPLTLTAA